MKGNNGLPKWLTLHNVKAVAYYVYAGLAVFENFVKGGEIPVPDGIDDMEINTNGRE